MLKRINETMQVRMTLEEGMRCISDRLNGRTRVNESDCHYTGKKDCPYFEPKYEEEHINRVRLAYYPHAWEDVINILLSNGYKVSIVKVEAPDSKDDKVEITWKDKNDLAEEFKKMVREIEVK